MNSWTTRGELEHLFRHLTKIWGKYIFTDVQRQLIRYQPDRTELGAFYLFLKFYTSRGARETGIRTLEEIKTYVKKNSDNAIGSKHHTAVAGAVKNLAKKGMILPSGGKRRGRFFSPAKFSYSTSKGEIVASPEVVMLAIADILVLDDTDSIEQFIELKIRHFDKGTTEELRQSCQQLIEELHLYPSTVILSAFTEEDLQKEIDNRKKLEKEDVPFLIRFPKKNGGGKP